eukprot:1189350-Prorocentrum_minimum.AAC.1
MALAGAKRARPDRPARLMCRQHWWPSQPAMIEPMLPMPPVIKADPFAECCKDGPACSTILPACCAFIIWRIAACTAPSGCTTCGSTPVPALPAIQASCTHRPCISCSGTKSSATVVYDTSPLSACMRAALQMSRLPISASRPPLPSTLSDAANMPADVRELSTSPTPEPCLVRVAHSWAKAVSRELTLACACRALACMRFLELPAVANTGTPSSASMDTAVSPTPPAAACTSTGVLVHRWWLAWWSMMWTVMDTVGMEAAWLWHREAGLTATRWGSTVQRVPRQPGARPKALSPTWSTSDPTMPALEATITPEQSPPGGPGSPGYIPRMLRTSRKLMPTA